MITFIRIPKFLLAGAFACLFFLEQGWPQMRRPEGLPQSAHAEVDGLAFTPPMGWYPWNIFGEEPQNEMLIKETVDALVASGMKDAAEKVVALSQPH